MEVSGISIAKAQAIENASVVSGVINGAGHLILTTKGGTQIDAGQVVPNTPINATIAAYNAALTDQDFATLAGIETLTNKSLALGNNTLTGTKAQFNTAMTDGDFATIAGAETLTNKNLADGTNTFPAEVERSVRYKNPSQAIGLNWTNVTWDVAVEEVGISWNAAKDTATVTDAGIYIICGQINYYEGSGGVRRELAVGVYANGTPVLTVQGATFSTASGNFAVCLPFNTIVSLPASGTVALQAQADTAGGQINAGAQASRLHIARIA